MSGQFLSSNIMAVLKSSSHMPTPHSHMPSGLLFLNLASGFKIPAMSRTKPNREKSFKAATIMIIPSHTYRRKVIGEIRGEGDVPGIAWYALTVL